MTHVVDAGTSTAIDHHDGTVLVDMDLDRDLDIISVGWTKNSLVIYENLAIDDGPAVDLTTPVISAVWAHGTVAEVVVDFSEPVEATTAENAATTRSRTASSSRLRLSPPTSRASPSRHATRRRASTTS